MKKLIATLAPFAMLAACSGAETTDEPALEADVAATETMAPVTDGGYLVTAGTYQTTNAAGNSITNVLARDGTYSRTVDGQTETGTWANEDGKTCFDPAGDDAAQPTRCITVAAPDADGTMRITDQTGETMVVNKTA